MMSLTSGFNEELLEKINDLLAEEVGPVAGFLAEESYDYWIEKLEGNKQMPSLRNIYLYINHLALSIDDEEAKKRFTDQAYSIESLKMTKHRSP